MSLFAALRLQAGDGGLKADVECITSEGYRTQSSDLIAHDPPVVCCAIKDYVALRVNLERHTTGPRLMGFQMNRRDEIMLVKAPSASKYMIPQHTMFLKSKESVDGSWWGFSLWSPST